MRETNPWSFLYDHMVNILCRQSSYFVAKENTKFLTDQVEFGRDILVHSYNFKKLKI